MPKIEVNEALFFSLLGERLDAEALEAALPGAKAELDGWDHAADGVGGTIKIELNDTNRPDLWSTAGLARQLRVRRTGKIPSYPFFVRKSGKSQGVSGANGTHGANGTGGASYVVEVDESVRKVRPYLAGFVAKGVAVDDAMLRDLIQTQEKLAWNYGRKRRTVSIGLYRPTAILWPVSYKGVDPDAVSFVPLQETRRMTLRTILAEHPKGREYASILEREPIHPLLTDKRGNVLSYPPIINSADLGAVQVGDDELFIEVTGSDMPSVCLTASIMSCDLSDMGFSIERVEVRYPSDTPLGRTVVFPHYFQDSLTVAPGLPKKLLGMPISAEKAVAALRKMGCTANVEDGAILVSPPEYRNDFLHPVDAVEDVMMGMGMEAFPPERPRDFTIGRLSPIEQLSRRAKSVFVGLGYQEMIYNYLGSGKEYAVKMGIDPGQVVKISNPMSENYEYVRNSPLPGLLGTESVSAGAVYPHRTFEIGKVALKDPDENQGVATRQYAGFLNTHSEADYNESASHLSALMYYLGKEFRLAQGNDTRFIPGRQAEVFVDGRKVGIFGEVHPAVLEAFGLTVPASGGEVDLDLLL